jgi:tripartite-type tricarboxylate transporter receptor subunit TctC
MKGAFIGSSVVVAAGFCCYPACAQTYPAKSVRLIVGGAPAAGGDLIMRPIAQRLSESTGQQFIIDNRPGAGSLLAGQIAAAAPADGYTILQGSASGFSIAPFLAKKRPYDPVQDFTPITMVARAPLLVAVHPALPVRSVKDLVALAKANPRALLYGSNGMASFSHLTTELFCRTAAVSMTHVPYKGGSPAAMDTVAGNVQLVVTSIPTLLAQVRSGRLRALAVTSSKRSSTVPEIPTVAESGFPGFESVQWYGMFAPKGTPRVIVERLHAEIHAAVDTPRFKASLAMEGAEAAVDGPEALGDFHRTDIARWAKVIRDLNIVLE